MFKVAAFYRFVRIEAIPALRREILAIGATLPGMCGTILLAPEGVNGTIAAEPAALDRMIEFLDERFGICENGVKYSTSEEKPFNRFKVRPKREIITMRCAEADPTLRVGQYVGPAEWNALLADPDVIVLDTRNEYETHVGAFEGAVDPKLHAFTEFADFVDVNLDPQRHKKVAMYCTGGIRCEKASAFMLARGFESVFHLRGGILKYLEEVPAESSKWRGECFVFDKRVAVGHALREGEWTMCYGCRAPISADDRERDDFEPGVSCRHCFADLTPESAEVLRMRYRQLAGK
ncbi:MAG: rhodanese-related sulfurtransferase [Phycisphaerales bacterium]|nr:rhodanese-related sulfurtransferase [Phycisphaerales bacterium]MCB9855190.1 rhodanese-related sulfurtransferase [Phycisphaerales bacterium]MCB9862783.1 rhodanese-related sulfurtransferase [Phycisphaerales bacterium]